MKRENTAGSDTSGVQQSVVWTANSFFSVIDENTLAVLVRDIGTSEYCAQIYKDLQGYMQLSQFCALGILSKWIGKKKQQKKHKIDPTLNYWDAFN